MVLTRLFKREGGEGGEWGKGAGRVEGEEEGKERHWKGVNGKGGGEERREGRRATTT